MTISGASDALVRVRRQWNSQRIATYPIAQLAGVRWHTVSGGVHASSPQPFLYAFVSCQGMLEGELDHSGAHGGPYPHSITVCIVKKDNEPKVFSGLCKIAGPKPVNVKCRARMKKSGEPCPKLARFGEYCSYHSKT